MGAAAVNAAKAVFYEGAGTVEFLVTTHGTFHFLEMNTRIQVEHPITECVTGVDLVVEQFRIAAGLPLNREQTDISINGHSIEVRIYAESPASGFLPATGTLARWQAPEGPGVRVDTGVRQGDEVTPSYDPMLAKLIVHASDRNAAIRRMRRALSEFVILGTVTNVDFLQDLIQHPSFKAGRTSTDFIAEHWGNGWTEQAPSIDVVLAVAVAEASGMQRNKTVSASSESLDPLRHDPSNPFLSIGKRFP
jgi:acetyl/propionyl-CoA carboxylase alpha subunit